MAARLTTHALDTTLGGGASGMAVSLRLANSEQPLASAILDMRGRATLSEALAPGVYELVFQVAAYHRAMGVVLADPPFLDVVTIRFGVAAGEEHYHVPLLISPYAYSTYRGS